MSSIKPKETINYNKYGPKERFINLANHSSFSLSILGLCVVLVFPLHISVSNQSTDTPQSNIKIEIDGKLIFQEKMSTDDQHKWKEIDVANTF